MTCKDSSGFKVELVQACKTSCVCAMNNRAGEVALPKPSGDQKIMNEFQALEIHIFTLWVFGFD